MNKKIIFSSGGTGGHVFPSIAIMNYFSKIGYDVLFVTDERGYNFLKNFELKTHILNTETLANKNLFKKIYSFLKIFVAILKSIFILKKEKPNLVFGIGGYASFPICLAAKILNIPLVIYENNLVLGRTNKILLPFATKLLVSTNKINEKLKEPKNKISVVGNLLREEIIKNKNFTKQTDEKNFSILVLGGSQGARVFGEIIPETIKKLNNLGYKIIIYQQCNEDQINNLKNIYNELNIQNEVFKFKENILNLISKSDIGISRCGASTLSEFIYTKTPFIGVPYPYAIDNHQYYNVKYYEDQGYCWTLEQENFTSKNLFDLLVKILKNKEILNKMSENMNKNDSKYTHNKIAEIIKELV